MNATVFSEPITSLFVEAWFYSNNWKLLRYTTYSSPFSFLKSLFVFIIVLFNCSSVNGITCSHSDFKQYIHTFIWFACVVKTIPLYLSHQLKINSSRLETEVTYENVGLCFRYMLAELHAIEQRVWQYSSPTATVFTIGPNTYCIKSKQGSCNR